VSTAALKNTLILKKTRLILKKMLAFFCIVVYNTSAWVKERPCRLKSTHQQDPSLVPCGVGGGDDRGGGKTKIKRRTSKWQSYP
jgi:hypothetical protein